MRSNIAIGSVPKIEANRLDINTKKFWKESYNRRSFLDRCSSELKLKSLEGWYNIESSEVIKRGGKKLIEMYEGSMYDILKDTYRMHVWNAYGWKKKKEYWKEKKNQRHFMDYLVKELKLRMPDGLYTISAEELKKYGGAGMLAYHNGSVQKAVIECYKEEYEMEEWMWKSMTKNFWQSIKNQRRWAEWFAREMKMKSMDEWYEMRQEKVIEWKGASLLEKYEWSMYKMVKNVFSEREWHAWKFHQVPRRTWDDNETIMKYREWLRKELGMEDVKELQWLRSEEVIRYGGKSLMEKCGGLNEMISRFFVGEDIESEKMTHVEKRRMRLANAVESLFPEIK